jgi:hypothetical protein
MEEEAKAEGMGAPEPELGSTPCCVVDEEATLLLVDHGSRMGCRIVELSLDGCRMSTRGRLPGRKRARVEVTFRVRGAAFRFSGVMECSNGAGLFGVRFVDLPIRRRDELVEVLRELEMDLRAKDAKKAEEKLADEREAQERLEREQAAGWHAEERQAGEERVAAQPEEVERQDGEQTEVVRVAEQPRPTAHQAAWRPAGKGPGGPVKRERRTQVRHEVDTSAVICLVNGGSRLSGRILDLSVGGCRIRTDERFPVGIYTRVETEFHLQGLPFRLGGVIQAIHDRGLVGIRFLDVSERKRDQLERLIEEVEEMRARQCVAER